MIKHSTVDKNAPAPFFKLLVNSDNFFPIFSKMKSSSLLKADETRHFEELAAHSSKFTVNLSDGWSVASRVTGAWLRCTLADEALSLLRAFTQQSAQEQGFLQQFHKMRKRLIQIFGFLITSLGWLFVLCTMAMDYWRITQLGGQGGSFIIKVAWYWSNLWKDCFTDSTAVTNCRDFPVLWSVTRKCLIWILYNLLTLSTK